MWEGIVSLCTTLQAQKWFLTPQQTLWVNLLDGVMNAGLESLSLLLRAFNEPLVWVHF